jgi:hypothetical protein
VRTEQEIAAVHPSATFVYVDASFRRHVRARSGECAGLWELIELYSTRYDAPLAITETSL